MYNVTSNAATLLENLMNPIGLFLIALTIFVLFIIIVLMVEFVIFIRYLIGGYKTKHTQVKKAKLNAKEKNLLVGLNKIRASFNKLAFSLGESCATKLIPDLIIRSLYHRRLRLLSYKKSKNP